MSTQMNHEELMNHIRAGDLASSLRTVKGLSAFDAAELLLKVGFSLNNIDNSPEFWLEVQQKLVLGTKMKMDGWQMREASIIGA